MNRTTKTLILLACFALAIFIAVQAYFMAPKPDVLSLSHEDQILDACTALLDDVTSDSSDSVASHKQLKMAMVKLRDGWPGFVCDNYYPYTFDSRNLLASVYWAVAKEISASESSQRKTSLYELLADSAPTDRESDLFKSYMHVIEEHDLDLSLLLPSSGPSDESKPNEDVQGEGEQNEQAQRVRPVHRRFVSGSHWLGERGAFV